MPDELVALLRLSNGSPDVFRVVGLAGTDRLVDLWQGWKQIFDEWPLEELQDHHNCPTGEALSVYTTPYWFPLIDEGNGDHAAIDLAPGPNGKAGQIIYFGADESFRIRVLADDLAHYLRLQREHVLSYDESSEEANGPFHWWLAP